MQKSTTKYGNEHEAIAVYNMMMGVQKFCPIYTLCVGNAFGEAALLLSAGSPVRGGRMGPAAVEEQSAFKNPAHLQLLEDLCRAESRR